MKLPESLIKELKKEAEQLKMPLENYIKLLIETHQDRVQKFVSILNPK